MLRVGDVRAFASAYGLSFPEAPDRGDDTWKRLRADHADCPGLEVSERIAYDYGVLHLISVFKDGGKMAAKKNRELRWEDVMAAQGIYDGLAAKKAV